MYPGIEYFPLEKLGRRYNPSGMLCLGHPLKQTTCRNKYRTHCQILPAYWGSTPKKRLWERISRRKENGDRCS